jgi:hypothetical protein
MPTPSFSSSRLPAVYLPSFEFRFSSFDQPTPCLQLFSPLATRHSPLNPLQSVLTHIVARNLLYLSSLGIHVAVWVSVPDVPTFRPADSFLFIDLQIAHSATPFFSHSSALPGGMGVRSLAFPNFHGQSSAFSLAFNSLRTLCTPFLASALSFQRLADSFRKYRGVGCLSAPLRTQRLCVIFFPSGFCGRLRSLSVRKHRATTLRYYGRHSPSQEPFAGTLSRSPLAGAP